MTRQTTPEERKAWDEEYGALLVGGWTDIRCLEAEIIVLLIADLEAAEAEGERLREAVAPFAAIWAFADHDGNPDDKIVYQHAGMTEPLRMRDVRRLQQALAATTDSAAWLKEHDKLVVKDWVAKLNSQDLWEAFREAWKIPEDALTKDLTIESLKVLADRWLKEEP